MRRVDLWASAMGVVVFCGIAAVAQTAAQNTPPPTAQTPVTAPASNAPSSDAPQQPQAQPVAGGKLHGTVKSGNTPLPGVSVTAQNTLTGKRYSTTTDITGAWSLTIPQNGRYVVRTQFAAFAASSQEGLLNAASRDQTLTFSLLLQSRALEQQQQQARQDAASGAGESSVAAAIRQLAGNGPQNLSLTSTLAPDT